MKPRSRGPLMGKRVLVTRARPQNAELAKRIRQLGGESYEFPTIRIDAPKSYAKLDEAIDRLEEFQWIVFTSVNAVNHFFRRLHFVRPEGSVRRLAHAAIAANGPKTAAALREHQVEVAVCPTKYRAEALLAELEKRVARGDKVLLPRANIARRVLADGLRACGCDVMDVDVYRTEVETENAAEVAHMLMNHDIDIVTFTSSSTARNFVKSLDQTGQPWRDGISQVTVACIGPLTARAAEELGLAPDVVAVDYTIDGMLTAIQQTM